MDIQVFKNISLIFFNSTSTISCGREFLGVIIRFKRKYFFVSILTLLPVKRTQQSPLVLALWGWMQRNFLMVFPQTSHYFVFHCYLCINISPKKKRTTTTTAKQQQPAYINSKHLKAFSRTFQSLTARKKLNSRKWPQNVRCTQCTQQMDKKQVFRANFFSPSAESVFVWASHSDITFTKAFSFSPDHRDSLKEMLEIYWGNKNTKQEHLTSSSGNM